jgi:prophage regulatory protein
MRKVLRKPDVLAATGWSNSTLYDKMAAGKFPKSTRLDPDGRIVVWFEDEITAFQKQAVERQTGRGGANPAR